MVNLIMLVGIPDNNWHNNRMNISADPNSAVPADQAPKKKLGPCCVCKETKKLRDDCLF